MAGEYIGYAKKYFDYAKKGPLHPKAKEAMENYIRFDIGIDEEEEVKILSEVRDLSAKLLGCRSDEIALVPSVSLAAASVAYSLPYRGKKRVITNNLEFGSNRFPWYIMSRFGYRVDVIKFDKVVDEQKIIQSLSVDAELLAISHIFYSSGYRANITEIYDAVKAYDTYLFLDAYQSVGVVKVDAKHSDFIATGSGKWLLSTPGAGFLYVKKKILEKLIPPFQGWFSHKDIWSFSDIEYRRASSGRMLEAGYPPILDYISLHATLRELLKIGIDNIERRVRSLTTWIIDELALIKGVNLVTPRNPKKRGGIISFNIGKNTEKLYMYLLSRGYKLSLRLSNIRISVHYFTAEEDISSLITDIKTFISKY